MFQFLKGQVFKATFASTTKYLCLWTISIGNLLPNHFLKRFKIEIIRLSSKNI